MKRTLVLDVVGLTPALLAHAPNLRSLAQQGQQRALTTVTPAVTCSAQSTMLTGLMPNQHGIVGNGWYFRDLCNVWFWRQSNHLVAGKKVWEEAREREPAFTCAKMFWWYNMYSSADWSVTPRPMYPADGRKIPDVYSEPPELRDQLNAKLGQFPLFNFWGPKAGIVSSQWIIDATLEVMRSKQPTLTLSYLPHLDYDLQRLGPRHDKVSAAVAELDDALGPLLEFAEREGIAVVAVSEYGITEVTGPVHINRVLREAGLIRVRPELGLEQLDAGASEAFAVADHQVAHIYVKDAGRIGEVQQLLVGVDGIESVLNREEQRALGLDHERAGELVAISRPDRWFSYYFWLDDAVAPDYARTVDIHLKPGYDPVELFLDPKITFPLLAVGSRLAKKKLGFRQLMDVIPLDASLVKGSHGRLTDDPAEGPVFITSRAELLDDYGPEDPVPATAVKDLLLRHVFE